MGDGDAAAPAHASEGSHPALLHPSLFVSFWRPIFLSASCAPARNLLESHKKPDEYQPLGKAREPLGLSVKVHTYAEYEDHFREAMKEVGLPVEKE